MQGRIPIVIGATGHRNIREEDYDVLRNAVETELRTLQNKCPHSEFVMLNSLAAGGDQLCAEVAKELSIPIIAVLPMEQEEYEKDFSEDTLTAFRSFVSYASACFVAPETEEAPLSFNRDFAYRQAGIYIASHAHVLLALWDGNQPASNCGTAEVVRFALETSYQPKHGIPLGGNCPVCHIQAVRTGSNETAGIGSVRYLEKDMSMDTILERTEEFNRLAERKRKEPAYSLIPNDREEDKCLDRLEKQYETADQLSVRFAKRYRRILAALAVISTVITVAFLLYDEAEMHWMILICGGMFLMAYLVQWLGRRGAVHRRYLEYRMLAEGLRVQAFLRYAGSKTELSGILPWSVQTETAWVYAALKTCCIGKEKAAAHSVRTAWIEEQHRYHEKAIGRSKRAQNGSERIVSIALWVSILLYLGVLVFEIFFGGLFSGSGAIANTEVFRMVSKLVLGSISAATLFISNYYGRLSLSRVTEDHEKMERFYAAILTRIDQFGESEKLYELIAREELIENGNWCSYQRDNTADFSL